MVYSVVLNASYEIKNCLLVNDFMFSSCFHVVFNNFLFHGWTLTEGAGEEWGSQLSNAESTLSVAQ